MGQVITVGEHLERVLARTGQLGIETVDLNAARESCLAEPVLAATAVPPWTNSAMDGYAVRFDDVSGASEDSPVNLRVVADIPAGSAAEPELGPMEAVRIMTGAPVPASADTVVPQELTDGGKEEVKIASSRERGQHIRVAGQDRAVGELVADAGTKLTPEVLAAIASAGVRGVTVFLRPRVTVISTGDELVDPGSPLERGQIHDSNGLLVSFLGEDAGARVTTDRAGDGPGELAEALERARTDSDMIVITGGVSVGAFDPVKSLFEGGDMVRFDRVAMQPGKPQAFGSLGNDGPLLFGLPGNPVSAWVSFQMFVRPALRKLQGFSSLTPEWVWSVATEDWKTPKGRTQIIPVRIVDGWSREVRPAASGGSGSHLIASLAQADGYARVPAETEEIRAGDEVQSVRLRDPEQFNHQQRSSS
ncbi:MAG: Molybdopterin molybdenumtransferase [Actinomycetota bacterium]|jgi:molybdopterin molybdotransferase|nr:Molybdopterin molybdenumtransferase [Actinomycetota bacterium]